MAVRQFSAATDDDVVRSIGALSGMTYGTIAIIVKLANQDEIWCTTAIRDSANDGQINLMSDVGGGNQSMLLETQGGDFISESDAELDSSIWYLIVVRKGTGTVAPRFSWYNFSTGAWTHSSGSAVPDGLGVVGGSVAFTLPNAFGGSGIPFDGLVAAQAVWSNELPWSADIIGDATLELAGLEARAQNWMVANPGAMWLFNQASTATSVVDLTGRGADQTSVVGTTVVTSDDPPGFNFDLEPVRQFDGVGDDIVRSIGALSDMAYGTWAFLVRVAASTTELVMANFHDSGGSGDFLAVTADDDDIVIYSNNTNSQPFPNYNSVTDKWQLFVIRKASGLVTPRISNWDYSTNEWFHDPASGNLLDATPVGAGGDIRFSFQGGLFFEGYVAAIAVWSNSLPWSTDVDVQNAGLERFAQNWLSANPSAMWLFNQGLVATNVSDITGNGADQTSITGTTVVTDAAPPGFNFGLDLDRIVASGGDNVRDEGGFRYHEFTGLGGSNLAVARAGSTEYAVVGGGSAGGSAPSTGGGGGAGGALVKSKTLGPGASPTAVGAGGQGSVSTQVGQSGTDSSFEGSVGLGGGGGGAGSTIDGANGGSGGGAGADGTGVGTPGTGTIGQGNDGGTAFSGGLGEQVGGGGGGATADGGDAASGVAGDGGAGLDVWSGQYVVAGGGGGGQRGGGAAGDGGSGGGGKGNVAPALGVNSLTDQPVAEYQFGEGSGTIVVDTASSHDGAITGDPAWILRGYGFALDMDGDAVTVPDHADLDLTSAFTLMAWVRPDIVGTAGIIEKRTNNSVDGWELSLASGGEAFCRVNEATSGNTFRADATSSYPTNGEWQHVAGTYDGTDLRIYVNGVLEATVAGPVSVAANNNDVVIGSSSSTSGALDGAIDDVRVFSVALTEDEIRTYASSPGSPSIVPFSDGSNLTSPVNTAGKSTSLQWWTGSRWDAVVPTATGWIIVTDIAGTPTAGPSVDTRQDARCNALFANDVLWIIRGHGTTPRISRYDLVSGSYVADATDISITALAASDADASPVSLHRTPNGRLWAAVNNGFGVVVAISDDDGDTWTTNTSVLTASTAGVALLTGSTTVVLFDTENGGVRNVRTISSDTVSITDGNWTTETLPSLGTGVTGDDHGWAIEVGEVVYVVSKTAGAASSSDPLLYIARRAVSGTWTQTTVLAGPDNGSGTRPSIAFAGDKLVVTYTRTSVHGGGDGFSAIVDPRDMAVSAHVTLFAGAGFSDGILAARSVVDGSGVLWLAYTTSEDALWSINTATPAGSGDSNTGGGGGGSGSSVEAGSGGSGLVVIRYPFSAPVSEAVEFTSGSSVTTATVNIPSDVQAGERLMVVFTDRFSSSLASVPTGWSLVLDTATEPRLFVLEKVQAVGTETTVDIDASDSWAFFKAWAFRISNHDHTQAAEAAGASGSTTEPDSPVIAPSWGDSDNLYLAAFVGSGAATILAYPLPDDQDQSEDSTQNSAVCSGSLRTPVSFNPTAFDLTATLGSWAAATVAVAPAVVGTVTLASHAVEVTHSDLAVTGPSAVTLGSHQVRVSHQILTVASTGSVNVQVATHAVEVTHQPLAVAGSGVINVTIGTHAVETTHQVLTTTATGTLAVALGTHAVEITHEPLVVVAQGSLPVILGTHAVELRHANLIVSGTAVILGTHAVEVTHHALSLMIFTGPLVYLPELVTTMPDMAVTTEVPSLDIITEV